MPKSRTGSKPLRYSSWPPLTANQKRSEPDMMKMTGAIPVRGRGEQATIAR
jgi:hypothetical protein